MSYTRHERGWIERRRREASEDKPSRSLNGRIRKATDKWSVDASWTAVGLANATVTSPPPRRMGSQERRGSGHSDPTSAQLHATYDTVAAEAETFAHFAGPCIRDGDTDELGRFHVCREPSATMLADLADIDLDHAPVVDALLGTPASSRKAFTDAVHQAASWHSTAAASLLDAWLTAYREGAEPSVLEHWTVQTEHLQRAVSGQAGRLAQWSGRTEPQPDLVDCEVCGNLAKYRKLRRCDKCRRGELRSVS